MESSKRIYVVLTTLLFLEASATDSFQSTNYLNNQRALSQGSFQNGPAIGSQSPGAFVASNSQNKYQANNLATNTYNTNYGANNAYGAGQAGSNFNVKQNSGYQPNFGSNVGQTPLNTGANTALTNTANSNPAFVSPGGLDARYGHTFNTGTNSAYQFPHNTGTNTAYGFPHNAATNTGSGVAPSNTGVNTGSTTNSFSTTGNGIGLNPLPSTGYRPGINTGSNTGYDSAVKTGSTVGQTSLFGNSNSAYQSTFSSGATNTYGNLNNGLNNFSNVKPGTTLSSTYPAYGTTSLPQSTTTNTQVVQNYNSNPLYPAQNYVGGVPIAGDDKFKIVHVPVNTGSNTPQTINLPMNGIPNYKVIHVNPNQGMPGNVLNAVEQAELNLHKTIKTPSVNNYDYNKNLPINVQNTLTKNDNILHQVMGDVNNKTLTYGYNYPASNNLYNFNQPQNTAYSQAQASATSGTVKRVGVIYDINNGKTTNTNNLIGDISKADSLVEKVLYGHDNQNTNAVSTSTSSAGSLGGQTNTLYNFNRPYDNTYVTSASYSNSQASSAVNKDGQKTLSDNELNALIQADLSLIKVIDTAEQGRITENEKNVQVTTIASSNSSTGYGSQYGNVPLYNNANYYPGSNTLQPYNKPTGYGYQVPFTPSSNSQATATATATATSTSQNGPNYVQNYPSFDYTKYSNTNGINQPNAYYPVPQYNVPYNNPSQFDSTSTAQSSSVATSQTENISGYNTNLNYLPNTYNNFNNYNNQFGINPSQPSVANVASSNAASSNVVSSNVASSGAASSNVASSNAASSNAASSNVASSNVASNYPSQNYKYYPQSYLNTNYNHVHSPIYVDSYGYQPNTIQTATTDTSTYTNNVVQTVQDSTYNNGWNSPIIGVPSATNTQQISSTDTEKVTYDEYGNIKSSNSDSTATADATSQSLTSSQKIVRNDVIATQSTDSPIDTTNKPINIEQEQNSTLYNQTTYESNNSTDVILQSNIGDTSAQAQSSTDSTVLYTNNNYDQYSPVNGQYYPQLYYNQPQTTEFPVDQYAVPNNQNLENFAINNLSSSSADNSTQSQSTVEIINDKTQDLTESRYEDKVISTVDSSSDVKTTTVVDKSSTVTDSKSENINYDGIPWQQQPDSYNHKYLYGNNHPRYNRLNWHKYGYPPNNYYPQYTNYPLDKQESLDNAPSFNIDDNTQTSSNDKTYTVASSQSEQSDVETVNINDNYPADSNDNPSDYQPVINSYNTDDTLSNNKQILQDNSYSNDNGQLLNRYDYSSNNQAAYDEDEEKITYVTTTTGNTYDDDFENYWEESTNTDDTEEIETNNEQTVKVDNEVTEVDSSSSTVISKTDTKRSQDQSSSSTGFTKLATALNTNADGVPRSRAFEALLRILESIEKLFGNKSAA